MSAYKSDFLQVLAERGFIHQVSDAAGLDAKAAAGPITAYVGFDATAPSLHIGNLLTIMMLRLAAEDRASSDCADGRRHQQDRRSLRQGHQPHPAHRRSDRRQYRLDPHRVLALSRFRCRRDHGEQRRLARPAALHFLPARRRPAFHHQQDADVRFGEAAARSRAAADVSRIQLHDPAGLRFR